MPQIYIQAFSIACALGDSAATIAENLLSDSPTTISGKANLIDGRTVPVGVLNSRLPPSAADTRCNRLADHLVDSLSDALKDNIDPKRLAVVVGTSTSGVGEVGQAARKRAVEGRWADDFRFSSIELGDVAAHIAAKMGALGPIYGISTACTSGAKATASAARLIEAGLCDAAIAGGIDSLCELTLNGFAALDSLAEDVSNPFSVNRRGINLGEGGALFILSSKPSQFRLAGGVRARTPITSARRIPKVKALKRP